jgi:hypothetical protein
MRAATDRSILRRKLAYPILTLCVAAAVYFFSRGQLGTQAPAKPDDYLGFAREVFVEVRAGRPIPKAIDPALGRVFEQLAPAAVRDPAAGALTFELAGPVAPGAGLPHVQSVIVRAPDGSGVGLSISILGGEPEVVGVSRVDPIVPAPTEAVP